MGVQFRNLHSLHGFMKKLDEKGGKDDYGVIQKSPSYTRAFNTINSCVNLRDEEITSGLTT
jgi:hypothetical protein